MKECRNKDSFVCDRPNCKFTTIRKENLDRHITTVHKNNTESENPPSFALCAIRDNLVIVGAGSKVTLFKIVDKKCVEVESVNTYFKIKKIINKNNKVLLFLAAHLAESQVAQLYMLGRSHTQADS